MIDGIAAAAEAGLHPVKVNTILQRGVNDDGGPQIVASVTRPFCGSCDRLRLTVDGQIRNCLFASQEKDIRATLRDGSRSMEQRGEQIAALFGQRLVDVRPARPRVAAGVALQYATRLGGAPDD